MARETRSEIAAHEDSSLRYFPWSSRFWEGGYIETQRKSLKEIENLLPAVHDHRNTLSQQLETSRESSQKAQEARVAADTMATHLQHALRQMAEAEKGQNMEVAKQSFNDARTIAKAMHEKLSESRGFLQASLEALPDLKTTGRLPKDGSVEAYSKGLSETRELLEKELETLATREKQIRFVRDSAIVAGTLVATGGTSSAVAAGAAGLRQALFVVIPSGMAGGMSVAGVSTLAEQTAAVSQGVRSPREALVDGATQLGRDAQSSLVTSVSAGGTLLVAAKTAATVSTVARGPLAQNILSGAVGGAGGATAANLTDTGINVALRGEAINAASFAGDLSKDVITGALSGPIGRVGSMARNGSLKRGVAVTVGEGAADGVVAVSIEAANAHLRGKQLSWGDVGQILTDSVRGTVSGELSARAKSSRAIPGTRSGAPTPDLYHGNDVRVHETGRVAFVSSPETMQNLFATINGAPAKGAKVAAFYDRSNDMMVVPEFDRSSRDAFVIGNSMIMHEHKHRQGLGEADAYRAQAAYLRQHGLHLSFGDGGPIITRTPSQAPSPSAFESQLDRFLKQEYGAAATDTKARAAATKDAATFLKGIDSQIETRLTEIPESPEKSTIIHLLSEKRFVDAQPKVAELRAQAEQRFLESEGEVATAALKLFNNSEAIEHLLIERIGDPRSYVKHRVSAEPVTTRNTNTEKELLEFQAKLHEPDDRERFKVLMQDLNISKTVAELKMQLPDRDENATKIRARYVNSAKFKRAGHEGERTVMKLYMNGGDRILIGFDGADGSNRILFAGDPHVRNVDYKPEVIELQSRFLQGGR
jgi:hypothetical protein